MKVAMIILDGGGEGEFQKTGYLGGAGVTEDGVLRGEGSYRRQGT